MHKSGLRVQSGVEEGCRNGLEQIQSDGAVVFGEVRVRNPSAGCGPLVDVPQARLQLAFACRPSRIHPFYLITLAKAKSQRKFFFSHSA